MFTVLLVGFDLMLSITVPKNFLRHVVLIPALRDASDDKTRMVQKNRFFFATIQGPESASAIIAPVDTIQKNRIEEGLLWLLFCLYDVKSSSGDKNQSNPTILKTKFAKCSWKGLIHHSMIVYA